MSDVVRAGARLPQVWRRLRPDPFVLSLVAVVAAASLIPCDGAAARALGWLGIAAISSLFFLQGARLSREAIVAGATHWRLHLAIAGSTFVLFPALGLGLAGTAEHRLPELLRVGILFLCVLPSTVQSSIALTSIARGNVAGALCAASASNVFGIVLTPLLLGALMSLKGGGIDLSSISKIVLELLVPFAAGHLLRPWIGPWAERNRAALAVTDRGSILLVVYTAFSAAVIDGVWHQLPLRSLAVIVLADAILLAAALAGLILTCRIGRILRPDEVAIVFCGSQKSLVSGVPIANAMFAAGTVGVILVPLMIYYQMQLVVCAWLARRYAATDGVMAERPMPMPLAPAAVPETAIVMVRAGRTEARE